MEVHHGKKHSEVPECGFCEYKASSEETLETHLITCEMYECKRCNSRFQTISNMKMHLKDDHKGYQQIVNILHAKMDRKNFENVSCREHNGKDFMNYK